MYGETEGRRNGNKNIWKWSILGGVAFIALIVFFSIMGYERIDAGFDGIRVNKYGDEKGVDKVNEVTGAVWYNKVTHDIYEVPTHILDYNFEEMEFKTKNMLSITVGAGVQAKIPTGSSPTLFVKYRRYFSKNSVDLTELVYKHTRQAFSEAVGSYNAEELITKKTEFRNTANALVKTRLGSEGFEVEDVFLIGDPQLPATIMEQVNNKIKADQIAQKKESELRQAEADAKKRVADAQGMADAKRIQADADRYAYQQREKTLTPLLVQQQFVEKWNGVLPVYGEVPELFRTITRDN